jgi:hypothetical protein
MYDMYSPPLFPGGPGGTGESSSLSDTDEKVASGGDATIRSGKKDCDFSSALQLALDRRDNGGDAGRPQ